MKQGFVNSIILQKLCYAYVHTGSKLLEELKLQRAPEKKMRMSGERVRKK